MSFKWNRAGHCGAPGYGSLRFSHSLLWGIDSSLHNLPWVPNSRFKQWLIREGRASRVKKVIWGQIIGSREIHQDQEATWGQSEGGQFCPVLGFPGRSDGKESACDAGDPSLYPGQEDPLEKGMALPTPVFLPGEFHGQRSLVCYNPWGLKEFIAKKNSSLNPPRLGHSFESRSMLCPLCLAT